MDVSAPAEIALKTVPVILNCKAGGGHAQEDVEKLQAAFAETGLEPRIAPFEAGCDLREVVRELLKDRPPVVVAAGGDGTVSSVADALHGTSTALGILPFGTLNHFAKDLRIPLDAAQAARAIAAGRQVAVDVGTVNGRVFINNASLGLYPGMVRERERQQRRLRRSKRHAMLWATLAVLQRPPLLDLRLEPEGEVLECRAPFVFIGNNDYDLEGFNVGTRARLDGGLLNVYTTRRCSSGGLIGLAFRALFGRLRQADDFLETAARSLRVASRHRRLLVATDGEVSNMETPLEFSIEPGSLRVIVP